MKTILAILFLAALLAAPAALAVNEPFAFGTARKGSLTVTSGALLSARIAELRGVWLDETKPCSQTRSLRVSVGVFFSSPSGATKQKSLTKTGPVGNCAEGGPNFGFSFNAKNRGFACANGKWKPGTYSFVTTTKDLTGGLVAIVSLDWVKTGGC